MVNIINYSKNIIHYANINCPGFYNSLFYSPSSYFLLSAEYILPEKLYISNKHGMREKNNSNPILGQHKTLTTNKS